MISGMVRAYNRHIPNWGIPKHLKSIEQTMHVLIFIFSYIR